MRRVYKYPVPVADEFDLTLPQGAEILHVAVQNYRPQLWALVDPDAPREERRFEVRGTGGPVDDYLHHLGTFLLADDTFVGHLFERVGSPESIEADLASIGTAA